MEAFSLIGFLLAKELPHQINFMAVGLPVVIAAIAVFFIGKSETEKETTQVLASKLIYSVIGLGRYSLNQLSSHLPEIGLDDFAHLC